MWGAGASAGGRGGCVGAWVRSLSAAGIASKLLVNEPGQTAEAPSQLSFNQSAREIARGSRPLMSVPQSQAVGGGKPGLSVQPRAQHFIHTPL